MTSGAGSSAGAKVCGVVMLRGKKHDMPSIKGRAWRSEGTEGNSFNDDYGAWPCARIFSQVSALDLGLQAASKHRSIAFDPEGSPLDHCYRLNPG